MTSVRSQAGDEPTTDELGGGGLLTVDIGAVVANWQSLAGRLGAGRTAAVVKADAYGLGADEIAPRLQAAGCRDFFVAELAEALALRPSLEDTARLHVLNGFVSGTADYYADAGISPVLNSLAQCRAWADAAEDRDLPAAVLQVDSGMSRLGLSVGEQEALAADAGLLGRLGLKVIMSHLANSGEPDHPGNGEQLAAFRAARARFPGLAASLSASGGIFLGDDYHFDLCRPGAALYGIGASPRQTGILPVAGLAARVAQVRDVEAGAAVGYGYSFRCTRRTRLATVGIGYADGWLRSLAGRGQVFIDGHAYPMVGRVSMDSFSVDITDAPEASIGEGTLVELIGPHQSVDAVAAMAGTIGWEILTSLGARYARVYR